MKNSIMKKTWGILLGFGVSLATAAFVLTGCVIEEADEATLTVNNGTSATDATIRLVLDGGTWNNPLRTSSGTSTTFDYTMSFAFDPAASGQVSGTTGFTAQRVSDTEVDVTFPLLSSTAATYSGNVKISSFYESTLKSFTSLYGTSTTVVADLTTELPITVTAASSGGGGGGDDDDDDDTTGGTAQGLADALAALLDSNQSAPACDVTGTTVAFKANKTVTIPTGITVTVPTGVTLTVAQSGVSGAKITLSGGTLEVDGILSVQGGDLVFSSTASTIKGEGVIEKNSANTSAAVALTSSNKLTIKDVTVKGITTGTQSQPVISVAGTAELTLDGAVITGNKNTSNGGGISISGTAKVTLINDAEVKGNTAAKGGGVYLDGSGELHIEKGTVYGSVQSDGTTPETADVKNTATASNGVGGAAIYLNAATTKVYGGSGTHKQELTSEDSSVEADDGLYDEYFKSAGSGSAGYTDTTLSSDGTGVENIAAR